MKPIVGITMGDPAGIGPELILKVFGKLDTYAVCRPVIIGSTEVLNFYSRRLKLPFHYNSVRSVEEAEYRDGVIDIIDPGVFDIGLLSVGTVNPECGKAAVFYTQEAGKLALQGRIDAVVSAPLNKEAMRAAGYKFEGQTQILGELCGVEKYGMFLVLGDMRVMMLTTHIALREACDAVTKEKVYTMLELADSTLRRFGIDNPKIGVAALNPHGGEDGLFGTEELNGSIPAIQKALDNGINAIGPVPADVIFVKAKNNEYDLVLAMFHDQANMAAKLLGFGEVVTVLAGLPIIRTSVGHGTAFNIAGKGIAEENNFRRAIEVAVSSAQYRTIGGN